MKKWEIRNKLKIKSEKFKVEDLIKILIENRGIKTKKETEDFLNPKLESLTTQSLGIDKSQLSKAIKRIKKAIEKKEMIVVFGDYDVDGITGTAILWETLNKMQANVMPYIPHRIEEGYGLSKIGISNVKSQMPNVGLIITVDNGIVANNAVEFANSLGLDVIITDHHTLGKVKPKACAIVHTTLVCGAAVAYIFSRAISNFQFPISNKTPKIQNDHLGLVALATVTDVMKLTDFNRTLLIFGLQELRKTKRPGLLALFDLAKIDQNKIGVYELGHIIGPRINAMGRLEHGLDSLRLLCTRDVRRAEELAQKLNTTNLERQQITIDSVVHAKSIVGKRNKKKLLFVSHESYEPGVIGLIAGKLTEEYYRPSIVISIGEIYSKASARSVTGFNIIEFIRLSSSLLVDAGGHPGAAGFTVETKNLKDLEKLLDELAEKNIGEDLLVRKLKIDCELNLDLISEELFDAINKLSPFGYGNPEPVFLSKNLIIESIRFVGRDSKHVKLELGIMNHESRIDGILFNYDKSLKLKIGDKVDVVYSIELNEWNGNKKIELKIKDIRKN